MRRYRGLAAFYSIWLVTLVFGCDRPASKPPSRPHSEPVPAPDEGAKAIVAKAVEAHGGARAVSRWKCGYIKYRTKGGAVPVELGDVTNEDSFQLPGYFKRVTHLGRGEENASIIFLINRGKGWTKKGTAPAQPIDSPLPEWTEHPFAAYCNMTPLLERDVHLASLGETRIGDRDAVGIRAKSDKLGQLDFYFDKQDGLVRKWRKLFPGPDPDRSTVVETFLDDYKDVQGAMIPTRIRSLRDGELLLNVTFVDVQFKDRFEEEVFREP